jgi:hypothetical protein
MGAVGPPATAVCALAIISSEGDSDDCGPGMGGAPLGMRPCGLVQIFGSTGGVAVGPIGTNRFWAGS